MAWNNVGNITGPQGPRGPQGPAGVMSEAERTQLFGSPTGTVKPYGSLRWSGPWYNPVADTFTRLRSNSDGRLVTFMDTGGVTSTTLDRPRLIAPVSGVYLLSATQTWGNDIGNRGIGLGTSPTAGDVGVVLWQDYTLGRITNATTTAYLTAGTVLYPWVWAPRNSGMSPADRGVPSEYSITFLAAGV